MKTKRIISEKDVINFFNSSLNTIEDAMGIIKLHVKTKVLQFDFNAVLLLRFDNVYSERDYSYNHDYFDNEFRNILEKCLEVPPAINNEFEYVRKVKNNIYNFVFKLDYSSNGDITIHIIQMEKLLETEDQLALFSNVVGAGVSTFIGSTWWNDYDRYSDHFYQSERGLKILGMPVNKKKLYNISAFQKIRDKARLVSEFYEECIRIETESYERVKNNQSDYFSGRTPLVTETGETLWVEAYGKCLLRYPNGDPRFFVAIDIYMSDIFEKSNQMDIVNTLTNYGLVGSEIGIWYHQRHFSEGRYYFTDSWQKQMSDEVQYENDNFTKLFEKQVAIFTAQGNGYEQHLLDFRKLHNSIYRNEIDKYHIVIPHQKNKDKLIWIDVRGNVIERDKDNNVLLFVGVNIDVTESYNRKLELERLRVQNERLQLAENLAVKARKLLVWHLAETGPKGENYIFGNHFFEEKLGILRNKNGLIAFVDLSNTLVYDDAASRKMSDHFLQEFRDLFGNKKDNMQKVLAKHKNLITGEIIYLEHSIQKNKSISPDAPRIIGGIMLEVTETILFQEQIKYLANYDTLTDTKNRNYFENFIKENLPDTYSILIFDIDGLKLVNDAFGHIDGDAIIKQLAAYLKEIFIDSLFVARIGGDEFIVLSEDVESDSITAKANQLEAALVAYNKISSIEMNVSKGGIIVTNNDLTFEKAFAQAENIMYRRKLNNRSSRKSKVLESILETLNAKTEETKEHSMRLSELAIKTIRGLKMSRSSEIEDMKLLAKVHDIGKITVPDEILNKPGKLTNEEYEVVKKHSEAGYKICRNITDSDMVCNGVLLHHERWDGKGYPQGLKGEEIPVFARVISIVDSYDAITNNRVYQKGRSQEEAISEIIRCSGTQFDPNIVKVFLKTCFDVEYDT